jgi:hypothetical protein
MEIGLVVSVRPVAAALLATACVRDTGAAAPAWDVVSEEALRTAALVVAAEGELGAPGPALGAPAEEGQGAPGPAGDAGDRGPTLSCPTRVDRSTCMHKPCSRKRSGEVTVVKEKIQG